MKSGFHGAMRVGAFSGLSLLVIVLSMQAVMKRSCHTILAESEDGRLRKAPFTEAEPVHPTMLHGAEGFVRSVLDESQIPVDPSSSIPEEAINALMDGKVNRDQIEAVYEFLDDRGIPPGKTQMWLCALKNDVMNGLRFLNAPPLDLTERLIRIYRDSDQDIVVRNYALQHLGLWYDQIARPAELGETTPHPNRSAAEVSEVALVLWGAIDDQDEGIGGTSLLLLSYLCDIHADIDRQRISDAALRLAGDESRDTLSRTSALQICALMGGQGVLPIAEGLAAQACSTLPLRLAAIAVLGDLGGEQAREILAGIMALGDEPLRIACESSINRIESRINSKEKSG